MKKYFMIECKLANGVTRYFCLYMILDQLEMRLVKQKNEAIIYTQKEVERAEVYLCSAMCFYNIDKYKIVKA